MDIFGIEAFLPGSQIDVKAVRDFDSYVGKKMEVKVIKINHANDNIVVSHKALIEQDVEEQKVEILQKLEKGQVLEGRVKNITKFGAFIDLGGVDGLLHITDISWGRIQKPEDKLSLEEVVKVVVLSYDENKKRISLGIKQLEPHPWDTIPEIQVGGKIKGKVVNITDYGAFVEIKPGIEGLIHISEMSWSQHLQDPRDIVNLGEEVEAVILSLDKEEHKMGLGLKQLQPEPWSEAHIIEKYALHSRHTGRVRNMMNYGVFVELEKGVDGLLHVSDLSWTKKVRHPSDMFKVGDSVDVVIMGVDIEQRRLSLSHKHVEENPWDEFEALFTKGSTHECTVMAYHKVAVLELPYGIEGICYLKNIRKENKLLPEVGDRLMFMVMDFSKEDQRIVLSHVHTYRSASEKESGVPQHATRKAIKRVNKESHTTTLGEIDTLNTLKRQMEDGERQRDDEQSEGDSQSKD